MDKLNPYPFCGGEAKVYAFTGGNMEPTEKQIKYAQYLAKRMCQEMPKDFTKQAYSDFISKWKPVVLEEDKAMNEPNDWQMQYM